MELIVKVEDQSVVVYRGEPRLVPFARLPELVLAALDVCGYTPSRPLIVDEEATTATFSTMPY